MFTFIAIIILKLMYLVIISFIVRVSLKLMYFMRR